MSRYIYITDDCLMDIAYEHMDDDALIGLQNALEEIPKADVVEVVRCKDCMFNHWHTTPHGNKVHICNLNSLIFSENADFYCAYGERREQ